MRRVSAPATLERLETYWKRESLVAAAIEKLSSEDGGLGHGEGERSKSWGLRREIGPAAQRRRADLEKGGG